MEYTIKVSARELALIESALKVRIDQLNRNSDHARQSGHDGSAEIIDRGVHDHYHLRRKISEQREDQDQ